MQLSTLISMPVLSATGEALGYVKNVYFTKNGLSSLVMVDDEEEEFYLPARAVLSFGDVIVAGTARQEAPTGQPNPIGKTVYTARGKKIGTLTDVLLEKSVRFIVTGEAGTEEYPLERLLISDAVIVRAEKSTARKKAQQKTFEENELSSPEAASRAAIEPPATHSEEIAEPEKEALPEPSQRANKPAAAYGKNLIGRRVKKTVTYGNYIIVAAGEVVTPAVIRKAALHNRLLELTKNTLTE